MKIKPKDMPATRLAMLANQNGLCGMCQQALTIEDAVMDHDHKTGIVRSVAHRACNSLEGKIVNAAVRFGVKDLPALLGHLAAYHELHKEDQTGLIYPTHKSPEEKKLAAAKKRKATRLKKEKK